MRVSRTFALLGLGASLVVAAGCNTAAPVLEEPMPLPEETTWGKLPLRFEENQGQFDDRARYVARQGGLTMFLTDEGAVIAVRRPATGSDSAHASRDPARMAHQARGVARLRRAPPDPAPPRWLTLKVHGAESANSLEPRRPLVTRSNYFLGDDPAKWRVDVPNFAEVVYRDILPGLDLAYHGSADGRIEYDFLVAPGVAADLEVEFEGADDLQLDADGWLAIRVGDAVLLQSPPRLYQRDADGRPRVVAGRYRLAGPTRVGFEIGPHDSRQPLAIDPELVYSTYLGGFDNDVGYGIAVDGDGAAYVAGLTDSIDFPISGATDSDIAGAVDAFVAKLSPAGDALVYSTYLGGSETDFAHGVAVDGAGAAYVIGLTHSIDFPILSAFQVANAGYMDAFVAKLSPAGDALVYSTYLGGSEPDQGRAVAVDDAGAAYVAGDTSSTDFPTRGALQPTYGGSTDTFVAKLTPAGDALAYSTFLGGSGGERGWAVAVDDMGTAYVAGDTNSDDFPTVGTLQTANAGWFDGFVAKLTTAGDGLVYSTYLGGSGADFGLAVAVDGEGAVYVAGSTSSANFPTLGALQSASADYTDGFVTKLTPAGDNLIYSTYLGGVGEEYGAAVAVDGEGAAYFVGDTDAHDFPIVGGLRTANAGDADVVVAKLTPAGDALAYSTYLGGSKGDYGCAVAVDGEGGVYVTGSTASTVHFPLSNPVQPDKAGGATDGFVSKILIDEAPEPEGCDCRTIHDHNASGLLALVVLLLLAWHHWRRNLPTPRASPAAAEDVRRGGKESRSALVHIMAISARWRP